MPRYINADKAIEILTEVIHDTVIEDADVVAHEVEYAIDTMPPEDVAQVVRCKDCIRLGFCGDETNLEIMGFYGFCSRAKKRSDA